MRCVTERNHEQARETGSRVQVLRAAGSSLGQLLSTLVRALGEKALHSTEARSSQPDCLHLRLHITPQGLLPEAKRKRGGWWRSLISLFLINLEVYILS